MKQEELRIELPKFVENYEIDLVLSYMVEETKDYKKIFENIKR